MQVDIGCVLKSLKRQVEGSVEIGNPDLHAFAPDQRRNDRGRQMAEVDRRSGIDCVHVLVADTIRLIAYATRQHPFGKTFRPVAKGEQAVERSDFQEIAVQQSFLPPAPFLC